jgi:hypothetical protein
VQMNGAQATWHGYYAPGPSAAGHWFVSTPIASCPIVGLSSPLLPFALAPRSPLSIPPWNHIVDAPPRPAQALPKGAREFGECPPPSPPSRSLDAFLVPQGTPRRCFRTKLNPAVQGQSTAAADRHCNSAVPPTP